MQHIINNVSILYPRLNQPYRFDSAENKSVACKWDEEGASYETSFIMEKDEAVTLGRICKEAYKNAVSLDNKRKWPSEPQRLPAKTTQGMMMAQLSITASVGLKLSTALIKLSNPNRLTLREIHSQVISG